MTYWSDRESADSGLPKTSVLWMRFLRRQMFYCPFLKSHALRSQLTMEFTCTPQPRHATQSGPSGVPFPDEIKPLSSCECDTEFQGESDDSVSPRISLPPASPSLQHPPPSSIHLPPARHPRLARGRTLTFAADDCDSDCDCDCGCGCDNQVQRLLSSSWTELTPSDLPCCGPRAAN